ncbi:hypothetical protein G7046_g1891 [Stylonectria norvegica]|nr:hypothetical protein G7046_g1891 [Stylonectria norvegica]
MSDMSPTSSTASSKKKSQQQQLFNTTSPICFAPRSDRNGTVASGEVVVLDPRLVQQWQLDASETRLETCVSEVDLCIADIEKMQYLHAHLNTRMDELEIAQENLECQTLAWEHETTVAADKGKGFSCWKFLGFVGFFVAAMVALVIACQAVEKGAWKFDN